MWTIWEKKRRLCDGVSRREFLRVGALGGLFNLADVFRLRTTGAIANVLSTLYRTIGIDPAMTFHDGAGRPRYLLDEREPVVELL
jgi:hypothetical protein